MSFILDALKKSEAERQRQAGPALLEMRVVQPRRRWPVWGVVLALLLIGNAGVLGWLAWRRAGGVTPAPVAAEPVAATPAAADPPATTAPAVAALPAPSTALPDGSAEDELTDAPPDYASISANLPALSLDLHVYSGKPAERSVLINMKPAREGQTTGEGVLVREITPDGVLLEFRGTRFVLTK